jgi:mycothiol synthase
MSLPDGYAFRPLREEELDAVAAMMNAEALALFGEALVPGDFVRVWWAHPLADRERDFVAVVDDRGELAGAFLLRADPPFGEVVASGVVDLAHHGRGIGGAVVRETERRTARWPEARVLRHASLDLEPVSRFFAGQGFRLGRRFLTMAITFDGPPPSPEPVSGIRVASYRPDIDARPVFELMSVAFRDHWGDSEETWERWISITHGRDEYDPSLWRIAWEGDRVAGGLVAVVRPRGPAVGIVEELAVGREFRRRGIGELLLRTVFAEFHRRGLAGAELGVDADSLTGATRLYERVGMRPRPRFAIYEKELIARPTATL